MVPKRASCKRGWTTSDRVPARSRFFLALFLVSLPLSLYRSLSLFSNNYAADVNTTVAYPPPPSPPFSRSERSDNPVEALGIQALAFVDNHFFAAAQDQCPAAMSAHDWWTRVLGQYLARGGELRDVEFGPTTIRSVRRHPTHNSTTFVQLYTTTSPCLLQTYVAPRFLICFLICFLVSAGSAHRRGPRSAACFQPRKHGPILRLRDGRRCGERE